MSLEVSIKKHYRGFTLKVSFVSSGGILGVLGASGSGKSLTLRSIAGIITPDQGRIVLNGRVLFDSEQRINLPPQERRVGYLFQNYALFPHFTVAQNIACGARGTKGEKAQEVDRLVERFHLKGLGGHYPGQLSGGQQQRVALARMLATRPEIFLLDEPFSALDAHLKDQLQLELLELLEEQPGDLLLVTHNRDEIYQLCPQLLVLEDGGTIAQETTKEIFERPELLPVARLLGCKNLSPVQQVDDFHLYALDWNLLLTTAVAVPPGVNWVGIRAHDLLPCIQGAGENQIPLRQIHRLERPYESDILCGTGGNQPLWWKQQRGNQQLPLPNFLQIPPDRLLLLADPHRKENCQ